MNFMSSAVHEAMSGETARGGTTERAAPGAARRAEQAESSASIRATLQANRRIGARRVGAHYLLWPAATLHSVSIPWRPRWKRRPRERLI